MPYRHTALSEVVVFDPIVYADDRGFFFESFSQMRFEVAIGGTHSFVQDNHSHSKKGVLRGLHYQLPPHAQGKYIRVASGEVFDVAVDIRRRSPTFGKWVGEYLSDKNKKHLWIPPGFAHGFLTLSDSADVLYKTTNFYHPPAERCIAWDDEAIGIRWPKEFRPLLSLRDSGGSPLQLAELPDV